MTWFHSQEKSLVWFGGCFMWTGEGIIHHHIPLYPIISPILVVIFPWYPHIGVYIASISPYWWLNLTILFGDGDPEIRRSKRPWRSRPLAFEQFLVVALAVKTKGKKLGKKYDYYIYIYICINSIKIRCYLDIFFGQKNFWGFFRRLEMGSFPWDHFVVIFRELKARHRKSWVIFPRPKAQRSILFEWKTQRPGGILVLGKIRRFFVECPLNQVWNNCDLAQQFWSFQAVVEIWHSIFISSSFSPKR